MIRSNRRSGVQVWAGVVMPALAAMLPTAGPARGEAPDVSLRERLDAISVRLERLDARVEGILDRIELRLAIVEVELVTLGAVAAPPVPELFVDAPEPPLERAPLRSDAPRLVASPGLFADLAEHAAGIWPAAASAPEAGPARFRLDRAELVVAIGVAASLTVLLFVHAGFAATARRIHQIRPP